ncbi:hypothetical protein AGRA3207_002192 [Actinomadura graeca]|uniref:Uncharacterized protein n=1 Tax=Actinomadura graeca TaxID=2750812 RepID=A0ABX8QRU0_9ACTN|nr:hypothetical protein [Actinomadura graeca]QXJ21348.1 hypothetical protein AGRA3207_002192 [Actinomadura graeca]
MAERESVTSDESAVDQTQATAPDSMRQWCTTTLPTLLNTEYGVPDTTAHQAGAAIWAQADAFAAADGRTRRTLCAPFVEEVFDHTPAELSRWEKAAVTVIVRNSPLEDLHYQGQLSTEAIQHITTLAAAAVTDLLGTPQPWRPLARLRWRLLAARYPRAWACLSCLADHLDSGGGWRYRPPRRAHRPALPGPRERYEAPEDVNRSGVVRNGMDPRYHQNMINLMRHAAAHQSSLEHFSALSRLSRSTPTMLRTLEFFLAHDTHLLTTNYLLTNGEVHIRQGKLVKPESWNPRQALDDPEGLSPTHAAFAARYRQATAPPSVP